MRYLSACKMKTSAINQSGGYFFYIYLKISHMPFHGLPLKVLHKLSVTFLVFITAFLFTALFNRCEAQPVQYRFQHLTSENGLPQNTVYDACQDKYGFMWFSTKNGVCRYDGFNTKVFRPTDNSSQDVVDLSQCIEADSSGNIVFGTSYGFYLLDVETDSIIRQVKYPSADSLNTYLNNVFSICIENNIIWAGTGNGLMRYDPKTDELKYFSSKELYPKLKGSRLWVKGMVYDGHDHIWLATPEALVRMNVHDYKTEFFNTQATGDHYVNNNYFSSIAIDRKGRLWTGTLRKGVYCFDFKNQTIDSVNYTGLNDTTEAFNETKRLICDSRGFIWAATQYTGLVRIHPGTKKAQHIRANAYSPLALASDLVSALFEDRSGILWAGTYNSGVDRTAISGSRFINIPFTTSDSSCIALKAVECFAEQDQNLLWVGTMKGLFLFDKETHQCKTFEEVTGGKIMLPHQSVAGLAFDKEDHLWIGTRSDVVLRVNLKDNTFETFQPDTSLPILRISNDFRNIVKRPDGALYISFGSRIFYYDLPANKLSLMMDRDSLLLQVVRSYRLYADEKYLFISCESVGLIRYDFKTNTAVHMESPDPSKDLMTQNALVNKFADGRYVVSDYKGFYLLDDKMKFTKFYNDKNGLSDNKICNTQIDSRGKLWMATFNGLSSFHPGTGIFVNYFVQDGLMENEFRESKSMIGQDGTLYFPTNKGFTFFHPDEILPDLKNVSVFFTGFRVFDKDKKFGKNINNLSSISIPAGFNFFTILFSSTAFNTLQPSVFAYKLEGVDRDWVIATGNSANYTNIDGGDYVFRVKAYPNGSSEKKLRIHVGTVFYRAVWFRLMLFFILVFVVYYYVRYREKQWLKKESSKTIDYFANSFYGKNSVEEILWDVCRNCISRLGFEDAVVYMVESDRDVLVQKAAYGPKNPKDFEIVHPLEIPIGRGIVGTVARSGVAEIIYDTTRDERYIADDDNRMSEIAVPIIYEGKVIGVIDSEHSQKRFFSKEHLRILTTIASICSTKIAKAQSDLAAEERDRRLLEIGKKVAETRLMALRAQMNPHFIFNSLNSIQECIVNEKIEDAHRYLSQFSRLLRMVIDYSEKSLISLDKEIEFLKLYLELESLRFGRSFMYQIQLDESIDEEETLVPSLLIQPFVENAIWHGLLHKTGDRKLLITFNINENDQLVCIVEDNGIGRAKAAAIKAGKLDAHNHESKGMRISQERIDLLRLQTHLNTEIKIEDLTDKNNEPVGTRVSVTLPLELESETIVMK